MKIAIDAGHGGFGVTPGKRTPDGSLYEWEFNSAVASKLATKLETCEGVLILRLDDPSGKSDVPLQTRTDKANKWGADVLYSQHANAYGATWNDARGIETYTYLSRPEEAVGLAKSVQTHIVKITGLEDRGVKAADLHMLRESNMTAILNEGPFMTNKEDAALLKSNVFREAYAEAVFEAFVSFFTLKKKTDSSSNVKYRLITGTFKNLKDQKTAAENLRNKTGWIVYEIEDNGLRLKTGTFSTKKAAQDAQKLMKDTFRWVSYIETES